MPRPRYAAQQFTDYLVYAGFPQLVGELVEMGIAPFDEPFPGLRHDPQGNGMAAVALSFGPETGLAAQGVHQPGLATGLLEDVIDDSLFEALACFLRMLEVKRGDIFLAEITQPQRVGFDVEGAASGDDLVVGGVDAVVAHVPDPAQEHRLREGMGTIRVAGPELAKQRDQGISHQGVHFVQKQNDGALVFLCPTGE